MQKLFHKDIFIPEGVIDTCNKLQKSLTRYTLSQHFSDHLDSQLTENDSHTYYKEMIVRCVDTLKDTQREVFEVELTYNEQSKVWDVTKYCCRVPCGADEDLAVVIRPVYRGGKLVDSRVITAWINARDDKHYTLDESRYCTNPDWYYLTQYKMK